MPSVPAAEIDRRVHAVQDELAREDSPVDLLLVVQKADLFYLSGTLQQCHLALPAEGAPPWRIGMELDVLPVGLWRTYRGVFGDDAEIVDCSPALLAAR